MANERLVLACSHCGEGYTIAKMWGGRDLQVCHDDTHSLQSFLRDHAYCSGMANPHPEFAILSDDEHNPPFRTTSFDEPDPRTMAVLESITAVHRLFSETNRVNTASRP